MFYLIGEKLGHSYSSEIHRDFGRYDYALREVAPEDLGKFIREGAYDGLNVTIPYKSEVIQYLDEIDDAARKIGSVNTVQRVGGRLIGHNTDYFGFSEMVKRGGISLAGRKVLILGTGGTSLTARAVAVDAGAREVVALSRRGENSYATIDRYLDSEIIINATPVGMYPENGGGLLDPADFPKLVGVVDVIYNPLRTQLVDRAERLGIPAVGGLYMLVAQAALACRYFSGEEPAAGEVDAVYRRLLTQKENIILVGMPSSGKSTVAAELARLSGRKLLDTDQLVEEMAGKSIPEIFRESGEAAFRALESEAIRQAGRCSGVIIATGGGAVLDRGNRYPLAQNGKIYHLLRDVDKLSRDGRPLSLSRDLSEMLAERLPHYLAFCDTEIDNDGTPERAAAEIWEDFHAFPDCKRAESAAARHS